MKKQLLLSAFVAGAIGTAVIQTTIVSAQTPIPAAAPAAGQYSLELKPDVTLAIDELKRSSNGSILLKGRIINKTNESFSPAEAVGYHMDKISLEDMAGRKSYEIMRTDDPLGTSFMNFRVDPRTEFKVWARFSAPPSSVKTVAVVVKGAGVSAPPLEDVPIKD